MILGPTWKYLKDLIEMRDLLCCDFNDLQILLFLPPFNMELLEFLAFKLSFFSHSFSYAIFLF